MKNETPLQKFTSSQKGISPLNLEVAWVITL